MMKVNEKPMSTNTVLHAKTAQSESNKFSSLSQEVVRRLLHTSRALPDSNRMENPEKFSQKLMNSGHKQSYVKEVIKSGIMKYDKKLKKSILPTDHKDYKRLHLGTHFNSVGRWKSKMMAKNDWYEDKDKEPVPGGRKTGQKRGFQKAGGETTKTSTVVFVPSSRGGKLVTLLKEREDELAKITKFRIRFQEAGGTKLALMFNTDLAVGLECGREDCQPCGSIPERRPNCKAQSILYESKCVECNPDKLSSQEECKKTGRKGIYVGESSRSLYERSKEHLKNAEDFSKGSHIVKHWMSEHPDSSKSPVFSFRIIGRYRDCLTRQVAEALRIMYTTDQILNSKNEYMANCLTRLCVEEDNYEKKKRERKEEEQEDIKELEAFKAKHKRSAP